MTPTALQRYQMRQQGIRPELYGNADILGGDVYANAVPQAPQQPQQPQPAMAPQQPMQPPAQPNGLVDRIYRDRLKSGNPGMPISVPTTKNRFA